MCIYVKRNAAAMAATIEHTMAATIEHTMAATIEHTMAATIQHAEVWGSRLRFERSSEVPLPAHVLFQAGRSSKHNVRAFKRYLGVLRGLLKPHHSSGMAFLQEADKCCLVCGAESGKLQNVFHRKCGPCFKLRDADAEAGSESDELRGVYVQVNEPNDDDSRTLMMCAECLGTPTKSPTKWPPGTAQRILLRHWRVHSFPYYESAWPRDVEPSFAQ